MTRINKVAHKPKPRSKKKGGHKEGVLLAQAAQAAVKIEEWFRGEHPVEESQIAQAVHKISTHGTAADAMLSLRNIPLVPQFAAARMELLERVLKLPTSRLKEPWFMERFIEWNWLPEEYKVLKVRLPDCDL